MVVDASAVADFLLQTDLAPAVDAVLTAADVDLRVPSLCDIEICSVLRKAILRNEISVERAEAAARSYNDLPILRHPHTQLISRILALHKNFTACDAAYVALAEALDASLLTTDVRFAHSAGSLLGQRVIAL